MLIFGLDTLIQLLEVAKAAIGNKLGPFIFDLMAILAWFFVDDLVLLVGINEAHVGEGVVDWTDLFSVILFELFAESEEIFLGGFGCHMFLWIIYELFFICSFLAFFGLFRYIFW